MQHSRVEQAVAEKETNLVRGLQTQMRIKVGWSQTRRLTAGQVGSRLAAG